MKACIPSFGGYGHRGRGEILHLFQMEVQLFGDDCQFRHIFFFTARMTGDEIRDQLLAQAKFPVDSVEYLFKFSELAESGFTHDTQYPVTGMFRCNFQAPADVAGY